MWFKGKFIVVLCLIINLFFLVLVTASSPTLDLDPFLPSTITENMNFTFSAEFSDENGFYGNKTIDKLTSGRTNESIIFNGRNQNVHLRLLKGLTATSATFNLTGYKYDDYVYYSFEHENIAGGMGWNPLFGYHDGITDKNGEKGRLNPDIIIKNIPFDFTANKLQLHYRFSSFSFYEFIYSIMICPVGPDKVCISDYITVVNNFTVTNHPPDDRHNILFGTNYEFKKGTSYKMTFTHIGRIIDPNQEYLGDNSLYQGYSADGNSLWDYNIPEWPNPGVLEFKLFSSVPSGPSNVSLYVGHNGDIAWNYDGDLVNVTTTTSDFSENFNNYVSTCKENEFGMCEVPLVFSSQSPGVVEISNIKIILAEKNLCQVCIAADENCDTEWSNTYTAYDNNNLSGTCSYYWDTKKFNNSNYEVAFKVTDTSGLMSTVSKQILLNRTLDLINYSTNSGLVKMGDFITINTKWNSTQKGNVTMSCSCNLYANDQLSQTKTSNSSECNFIYPFNNSDDYPAVSFYVTAQDQEKKEGISLTMLVKVGLNQSLEADTPTELDFISLADSNVTLFLNKNLNSIIAVTSENLTSSPPNLNALKAINIEVDEETKEGLLWGLIKIFYDEAELTAANIDESTLKIYYYNESAAEWQLQPDQGVDTENNYVWLNATHFSTYGVFGDTPPAPSSDSSSSSSGGGSSGGGGGGGSNTKPKAANTTVATPSEPAPIVNTPPTTAKVSAPVEEKEETEQPAENLAQLTTEPDSTFSGITGAVVGLTDTVKERPIAVAVLAFSLALLGVLTYQSIKRKKNKEVNL